MSSYICSPKHFNSIEKEILKLISKSDFSISYSLRNVCPKWYSKRNELIEEIENEVISLINTLRELNVLCVSLQYKEYSQINEQLIIVKTKTEVKELDLLGLYNALNCLNYQIELEHLINLRALTEIEENAMFFLKEFTILIGKTIIQNLPPSKTNSWSID